MASVFKKYQEEQERKPSPIQAKGHEKVRDSDKNGEMFSRKCLEKSIKDMDSVTSIRIYLQRAMGSMNDIIDLITINKKESEKTRVERIKATQQVGNIMVELLRKVSTIKPTKKVLKRDDGRKKSVYKRLWKNVDTIVKPLHKNYKDVLDKWDNILHPRRTQADLRSINKPLSEQIQGTLKDIDKLRKRTRLYRGDHILRMKPSESNSQTKKYYNELYDDRDFYESILKSVLMFNELDKSQKITISKTKKTS